MEASGWSPATPDRPHAPVLRARVPPELPLMHFTLSVDTRAAVACHDLTAELNARVEASGLEEGRGCWWPWPSTPPRPW